MFETKFVKKIKTHILCLITFSKNRAIYQIMSKNVARTHTHTHREQYNTYCFSTATMIRERA